MAAHLFRFAMVMTTTADKTTSRSLATKTLFPHFTASCRSCDEEVDFVRNKCIPGAFAYNDLSHCWAISVTHAIEVEYTIKTRKRVRLSVQELIDNCFQDHRGWSRPDIAYSYAIRYGLYKYEDYPTKRKGAKKQKSYHGSTLIAASLSGLPALHQKFDLPVPFVLHTDCPHYWRFHLPGETEEEFSTRLANNLENLILKEGPETIGAFIAEPVMGAGGVIPPPATYFEKIQAVVKKYDILFIADEVICAFGRLGTTFGCDMYNIKPDLVSLAKALSSAYMPIGAVLVSSEVSDVIHSQSSKLGSFSHGFTYSGHPVACAVALEALKIYKERNIVEQVQSVSPRFQDGIKAFSSSPIIGEIRGTGLILGTEFTDNKSPNDLFPPEWGVGAYFGAECEKRGMLVRVAGDSIMMSPAFIISPAEVDLIIRIYGEALKATEERVKELKSLQKQK